MFGSIATNLQIPTIAIDVKNLTIGKSFYTGSSSPKVFVLSDNVKNMILNNRWDETNKKSVKKQKKL